MFELKQIYVDIKEKYFFDMTILIVVYRCKFGGKKLNYFLRTK